MLVAWLNVLFSEYTVRYRVEGFGVSLEAKIKDKSFIRLVTVRSYRASMLSMGKTKKVSYSLQKWWSFVISTVLW